MRKFFVFLAFVFYLSINIFAQQPKYVFYFIGDGMGLNAVNITEYYLASVEGKVGLIPLSFTQFPYVTYATTHSANKLITDSAAAGTALATGSKTNNGVIGQDAEGNDQKSVATRAKESGKKVGICTTVGINHATPAAFYAHQNSRKNLHDIGLELLSSRFDFFGGTDFYDAVREGVDLHTLCQKEGYTMAYGLKEAQKKSQSAQRLIMVQSKENAEKNPSRLPYAIDRTPEDLTLSQLVETGIQMLTNNNENGFFFMVEGGSIDYACHAKDAPTVIQEVIDFDKAIQVAYNFYLQHPKETLIVVTADHETGGLSLATKKYVLDLKLFQYQKCSIDKITETLTTMKKNDECSWDDVKNVLQESMGLFSHIDINSEEEKELHDVFDATFAQDVKEENLYSANQKIVTAARDLIAKKSHIAWSTKSHSAAYVPVYALGEGAELFHGRLDNTEIPRLITKIAGYR